MATDPTYIEQVQSNIPAWMQPYAQQLLGSIFGGQDPTTGQFVPGLIGQGYQPYMVPQRDAQGNIVRDEKGNPVMRPGQRVAEFSPLQRQAFEAYAGMKPSADMAEASRLAREAGARAEKVGTYDPAAERDFYTSPEFRSMETGYDKVTAPALGEAQMTGPQDVTAREYGPINMAAPERVGIGALQQYRVGAPERVAGPAGPERITGPQLQQYQMTPAQQVRAAELERLGMVGPRDVAAPELQQFRMEAPERVGAERVGAGDLRAAQTSFRPELQAFEMGPAERVGAERFGLGAMQEYMSPYMQGVVGAQKRAATQDYLRQLPGMGAAAARAGAKGGTREALLQAEARRGLSEKLSDIEATGLQSAYQQAAQQFGADRAAQMQAALANQQAGLTTGQQNLAARLGVQQLGTQTGAQIALANLSNEQQARVQQEANRLQASGMNQQAALQTALANQQAGMTTAQQNLAAQLQTQGLSAEQAMRAALANQQMGYNVGAFNVGAEQQRQQL